MSLQVEIQQGAVRQGLWRDPVVLGCWKAYGAIIFQLWLWIFLLLTSLANMIILIYIQLFSLCLGIECSFHYQNDLLGQVPLQREPQKKRRRGMKNFLTNYLNHLYNVEEVMEAWISMALVETLRCWNSRRRNLSPSWSGSCSKEKQCWSSANFCAPAVMLTCSWLGLRASFLALEVTVWKVLHFRIYYLLFNFLSALFGAWCCGIVSKTWVPINLLSCAWPGMSRTKESASHLQGLHLCGFQWKVSDTCVIRDYSKKQK